MKSAGNNRQTIVKKWKSLNVRLRKKTNLEKKLNLNLNNFDRITRKISIYRAISFFEIISSK